MKCRFCKSNLNQVLIDLNFSPVSNDMLMKKDLDHSENYYPLKVYICDKCFLVQHGEYKKAKEIFDNKYTYFSSYSKYWLDHSKKYVDMMMKRFKYTSSSLVVEIASNDGYLLQYFLKHNVPVLGIDPTRNTTIEAERKGIKTIVDFFCSKLAKKLFAKTDEKADLIIGNNVLAHVPKINDFVKAMKLALKDDGVITMEFPHLLNLIKNTEFDTIYHEHFSYLSLISVTSIFEKQGLIIFDIEELPTHGGSLRIFAKHSKDNTHKVSKNVEIWLKKELNFGLDGFECYKGFQKRAENIKNDLLSFLIEEKRKGKKIIGYGAASKGNTLLNYCGIKGTDLISFVVDASPFKQNKYLPGSHIPVISETAIKDLKPDYVIILPWNLKDEISNQLAYVKDWGGKFVIFIPELTIF